MKNAIYLMWAFVLAGSISFVSAQSGASNPASALQGVKDIGVKEAARLLKEHKEIVVLDVRTPKEFDAGRIAGAKNVDFYAKDFQKQLAGLDKSKTYLVHCAVGGRSAKARDLMKKLQFKSVLHLDGGLKDWEKAGHPVEK